uniref:Uncharacterized protein n=1 Tax=Rhizophagus irregularis (strain DAOM 181602 / DAOM 197198 / MUCL 43194) TaxID=747089 RepID=U9U8V6_RHIID
MPRSDKKDTTCACYDYKFTKPAKLRQHYQTPLVHTQGRDRRMEQPKAVIPTPEPELASIKDGPKTEYFGFAEIPKP